MRFKNTAPSNRVNQRTVLLFLWFICQGRDPDVIAVGETVHLDAGCAIDDVSMDLTGEAEWTSELMTRIR